MSEKDLSCLISEELSKGKKVELVLTKDIHEGDCLAVKIGSKEYFLAWETFEGIEPLEEYLIRKPLEKEAKKQVAKK